MKCKWPQWSGISRELLLLVALGFLLGGCGGSSPGGSGGGIGGSGISDTDVTIGNITGFGSVFINRKRFDTLNTDIFVNGSRATEADLRLGMVVTGIVDFDTQSAARIEYLPQVIGPVTRANGAALTFEILGLTIRYRGDSSFDGMTAADVAPGVVLEVSGVANTTGTIEASYIRMADPSAATVVQGIATASDVGLTVVSPGFLTDWQQELREFLTDLQVVTDVPLSDSHSVLLSIPTSAQTPQPGRVVYAAPPLELSAGWQVNIVDFAVGEPTGKQFASSRFQVLTTDETVIRFEDGSPASLDDISFNTRVVVSGSMAEADRSVIADVVEIVAN